jgi:thiamine kinase-like enzyme
MKQPRQAHRDEVRGFLQRTFRVADWTFSLPDGSGHESYFAHGGGHSLFVKLGADVSRAVALSQVGLTPQVIAEGRLDDGISIQVQPFADGRKPSRKDYHERLEQIAAAVRAMHHDSDVARTLPHPPGQSYSDAALAAIAYVRQRWSVYGPQVADVAPFVDDSLDNLENQARCLSGSGLAASHNDLCDSNMLLTRAGKLYIIDFDMMSLDDPADDIGTLLWWYYPPHMRQRFLEVAGYAEDAGLQARIGVRMPLHLLRITLPREGGFDVWDPASYAQALTDFQAAIEGKENPQGYED